MAYFAALVVDGALAGALYAPLALSFVVVYRASRIVNFAVGEWVMLAARFVTFGLYALGLGLPGALLAAGIDLHRHFALTWALAGIVAVLAGTLWTIVAGGGLGIVLVGLRVFPIVIVGGLDSIAGAIVGALIVGVVESLAAGYVDPLLGG